MNDVMNFVYEEHHQIRSVLLNGEPWFVAADVCAVLEITNPSDALRRLDEDERTLVSIEGASNGRPVNGVNEPGLYSLILGSRKPEARHFKRWITHDVIPQIRKRGAYMTPQKIEEVLLNPDTIIQLATQLKQEREAKQQLEAQIEADKPKVIFAEALQVSRDSILVADLAKILKQNGIDIGQNRLYVRLREEGYLGKFGGYYNTPTQRSMEMKLFEIQERVIVKPDGTNIASKTTRVTGKGQLYFINKFKRELVTAD